MKIFSTLVAFAMVFASFATVYADVALPPRPTPRLIVDNKIVTVSMNSDAKLFVKFVFPYDCNYNFLMFNDGTGEAILIGEGTCNPGDTIENAVNLQNRLSTGENIFRLNLQLTGIKIQTRFGKKVRGDEEIKKVLIVKKISDRSYSLSVSDGD